MRVATTGRPFHIASATVSPKPSATLFWATTAARALERVDDRRVLLEVVHRQRGEVHAGRARRPGARSRRARASSSTSCALGVVGHGLDGRAGVDEVDVVVVGRDVLGEAVDHAQRVLQRSQRETCSR